MDALNIFNIQIGVVGVMQSGGTQAYSILSQLSKADWLKNDILLVVTYYAKAIILRDYNSVFWSNNKIR